MTVRNHAAPPGLGSEFSGMRMHCLGVGGIGMSGIARLLAEQGAKVSGCDVKDSSLCEQLREAGIHISIGHDPSHVKGADCLVVSSAVAEDNAECVAASAAGIPILHRSQALARSGGGHTFIAVTGTHGKTTTSSMLTAMLEEVGKAPSFAVGGIIAGVGTNARYVDSSALFVAEADESDGSFLAYDVDIAVITSIEADHLDYYGSAANVDKAFEDFVRNISPGGTVVLCADDAGVRRLLKQLTEKPAAAGIVCYGRQDLGSLDPKLVPMLREYYHMGAMDADFRSSGMQGARVHAIGKGSAGKETYVCTPLPGRHNVSNAVAAFAVSQLLGIDAEHACSAISAFPGVERRFELKGEANGIKVYDDYAHHPTEVQAVLRGARDLVGNRKLHVIFQPHLYSRTRDFAPDLARALDSADRVLVLDIYGAREDPIAGVTSELITGRMKHAVNDDPEFAVHDGDDSAASVRFAAAAKPGDIVITVGAGDVTWLGPVLLKRLAGDGQEFQ